MYEPYMEHSGVKGMHWGIRRYQNMDGSLTPAGRAHYGVGPARKFKTTVGGVVKGIKRSASNAASRVKKNAAVRRKKNIEKLVRSGNIKKLTKKASKLTDSQFDDAISRANKIIDTNNKVKPKKDMIDKIERVIGTIDKGAKMAKNIYDYKSAKVKYQADKRKLFNLINGIETPKEKKGEDTDKKPKKTNEQKSNDKKPNKDLQDARDESNKKVEEAIEKAKKPSYGERVAAKRQTFAEQLAKNARARDEEKYIDDLIRKAKRNRRKQEIWGL